MALCKTARATSGPVCVMIGFSSSACPVANAQIVFEPPVPVPTTSRVIGLVLADLDGDGNADLATAEYFENLTLYINRGGAGFERMGSIFDAGRRLSELESADLNGDHYRDLAWITQEQDPNSPPQELYYLNTYTNAGPGRKGLVETIELGHSPVGGMATGRFTRDPFEDVVVVDGYYANPPQVSVFVDEGEGLSLRQRIALFDNDIRDVAVGDIDGDGDTDICALNLKILTDYYGTHKVDASRIVVLLNDGSGTFEEGTIIELGFGGSYLDPIPLVLLAGDLDGDADLDLALAAASYYQEGPAVFQVIESIDGGAHFVPRSAIAVGENSTQAPALTMGDLDTDGDLDFVLMQTRTSDWVLENQGGLVFERQQLDVRTDAVSPVTSGDVDDDGMIDLATSGRLGAAILRNATERNGPVLGYTPLKRSLPCTQTVTGANPGETVHFLYTLRHAGNSVGIRQLGGITLDMNEPIQMLGSAVADANGVAEFHFTVPPNAPLAEVVLQAVIRRGPGGADSVKTPFRTARIGP